MYDGLWPQHLKNLIGTFAESGGKELLSALTDFFRLVINGKIPPAVRFTFYGASLIALEKKGEELDPLLWVTLCSTLQLSACAPEF